jgi:signal transduction histidine kinase
MVEIHIEDNGNGIDEEVRKKIFQPFYTTKPPGLGNTGLGLSISYDIIITQHRGQLDIETEPGKYTKFTIKL